MEPLRNITSDTGSSAEQSADTFSNSDEHTVSI